MDDIPKDLFADLDSSNRSPPRTSPTPSTTTQEAVQLLSTPPINIITNPGLQEEGESEKPKPAPKVPSLPPPVVAPDGNPLTRPKKSLGSSKFSKTKWQSLQRQVLQAAQEQSAINPPPPVPVNIEGPPVKDTVFPVVAPTHTSTHQPALVVPLEPKKEPRVFPGRAQKKLSFLSVVQAARAKAKEGLQDVLDTGGDVEGIVRGEEPPNVVRVPSPPQSPALSSYTSSTSPYPSPAHYGDKQSLLHHQQKVASQPLPARAESALSRLQSRVSQGDVQALVVQPEAETQSVTGTAVSFESAVMTRLAQEQSQRSSPAKMRWKNLKHQAASSVGDAARAVRDELTNTSSASVIDMGSSGDGGAPEENGTNSNNVVSNTGQPRSVRRPRRVPNGMGPQVHRAADGSDDGVGICGFLLTGISWLLVLVTLPFSLCVCFKVVQEYERAVIFRLGRLLAGGSRGPGIFFVLPCIESYQKVDLRTITLGVPPQEVLTKDSVTVSVDAVVYYRVSNATVSVANVENAHHSTRLLAQTTLRNILGTKNLHEILSDRESISGSMQNLKCSRNGTNVIAVDMDDTSVQAALDEATEPWGIKVERVEIKDVRLPVQLQRAMAAEAEAAREARAKVIAAEGEQKASRALREASEVIADSSSALQLRYLQTLNNISAEKNSTIIFPLPIDLITHFMKEKKA